MIIKNNFNTKSSEPLSNYQGIGKGRNSLDHEMQLERDGYVRENLNNGVIQDILNKDREFDDGEDDSSRDKWDFFK